MTHTQDNLLRVLVSPVVLDLSPEQVADSLWLAAHIRQRAEATRQPIQAEVDALDIPPWFEEAVEPNPQLLSVQPRQIGNELALLSDVDFDLTIASDLQNTSAMLSPGIPFRTPISPALPESLAIARALRPLQRRVPSRVRTTFDEAATVEQIAETGVWVPVLQPHHERWLDLDLIIDATDSLQIWHRTIAELQHLLAHHGAFRRVRGWRFQVETDGSLLLLAGIRPEQLATRSLDPRRLRDPAGRQLIVLITDGTGPHWRAPALTHLLNDWGRQQIVTIIQVLPDWLWRQTNLGAYPITYLRNTLPGAPSARYQQIAGSAQILTDEPLGVPIVTLEPAVLTRWAQVIAGIRDADVPALQIRHDQLPRPMRLEQFSIDRLISRFVSFASPEAVRLSAALIDVPVTLHTARLIQSALSPHAGQTHLAEVLLSGLLRRDPTAPTPDDVEQAPYHFISGAKERLRTLAPPDDRVQAFYQIGAYIGSKYGLGKNFLAWLKPAQVANIEEARVFARLAAESLRGLGGVYAEFAERFGGGELPKLSSQPSPVADNGGRSEQKVDPLQQSIGDYKNDLINKPDARLDRQRVKSDQDLYQRVVEFLRNLGGREMPMPSDYELRVMANELMSIVPAMKLARLTDSVVANYLRYHNQVSALRNPESIDHHNQWQIAIRRIRYIAELRGFRQSGDDAVDIEDLVQTIANEFHQSLARYSYAMTLETWLHSVTIRQLKRFLRNRGAAKRTAIYAPFERAELVPDPSADEAHIHSAELAEQIRQILERQKDGKRLAQVFLLHALADQSAEAIGKLIRRNPSRVRAMLNIAREILRRELANDNTDVL